MRGAVLLEIFNEGGEGVVDGVQEGGGMASQPILPAQTTELVREAESSPVADSGTPETASHPPANEMLTRNPRIGRLPVELDVAVPVRDFRVRNLLSLEKGVVIESQWGQGEDLPLSAGAVQLAWSEFEVIDTLLAVRVTRVA
jgi:flagellar motor switch/type III secretory pathway protein FliN